MKVTDPAKTYTHLHDILRNVPTGEIERVSQINSHGGEEPHPSNSVILGVRETLHDEGMTFHYRQMRRIQLAMLMLASFYDFDYNSTIELEVLEKTEIDIITLPPKGLLLELHANGTNGEGGWAEIEGFFPIIVSWEGYSFMSNVPDSWPKEYRLKLSTGESESQEHTFLFSLSGGRLPLSSHQDLQECLTRAMILDLLRSHARRLQLGAWVTDSE